MASNYLDPDVLSKVGRLDLKARYVVEGFIAGMHKSPFQGYSVEFAQHRGYVPGDDLKHLDWKVYAKNGRYCIKQYEAETNLVCTALLDASESMAYVGTQAWGGLSKLEYAKIAVAALSYLVLSQSDAMAMGVFAEGVDEYVERSTRKIHLNRICAELASVKPERKTAMGPVLHTIADRVRRRGIIVLFSDLFTPIEELIDGLQHLRHLGHEVVVLHLLDHDELTFAFDGLVQFDGLEIARKVLCQPRQLKKAYLGELEKFLHKLKAACQGSGVDYHLVDTTKPVDVTLSAYLGARARMARGTGRAPVRA